MSLKLQAEIGMDSSGFESGLKRVEGMAEKFSDTVKGFVVGAVGIYTMEQAISKTVETAKELVETSERLSIAPEQLQVLREAARAAGKELGDLATAFEKVDIARAKALQPGQEGHDLRVRFGQAGINDQALRTMTAAQLFSGPLSQFARSRNAEDVGPVLRDILGKGFGELMPVLKTDFGELEKKMRSFGAIMDTETAVKLAAFSKELTLVGQIVTSQLGPALVKLAEIVYETALKIAGGWVALAEGARVATSKLGLKDLAIGGVDLMSGNITDLRRILGKVDTAGGKEAAVKALEPFQAKLGAFQDSLKRLAEQAEELKHPVAASFTDATSDKLSKRALETPSDSLTKVGNFLGGFGPADRWQQQKVDLLRKIEKNTDGGGRVYPGIDPYNLNSLLRPNDLSFPGSPG